MQLQIQSQVLILHNPINLKHSLSIKYHPQNPTRITSILNHLTPKYKKQIKSCSQCLQQQKLLNDEDVQQKTQQQILLLHGQRYYDFVEGMWCQGISKPEMFINIDTYYMKDTYLSALQAAKTTLLAADILLNIKQHIKQQNTNSSKSQKAILCLVRPPGHHSGMKNQPHGFSFFNNISIAANYYVSNPSKKVAIIDWDIHHGEGTQKIFYDRKDVLYISLHRYDNGKFFPHIKQSHSSYIGSGKGQGHNINICWNFPQKLNKQTKRQQNQTIRDKEYIFCFKNIIMPILSQFQPDAIFISCGFDCALNDPIGESRITDQGFKTMAKFIKNFNKPILLALQGGYDLQSLKSGTQAVLEGLQQPYLQKDIQNVKFEDLNQFAKSDIKQCLSHIQNFWKIQQF